MERDPQTGKFLPCADPAAALRARRQREARARRSGFDVVAVVRWACGLSPMVDRRARARRAEP